ncbi:MAG: imidazoleglycerol-phosphate dehydratase HisB [Candidatus Omnitrophica bacterium]|nr:imidazoleglycerol-phosphate dehydratase HisB [Candidatus Omnitrophota bacterium]
MRKAKIVRNTRETQITLTLSVDGQGRSKIQSGIGFLDHMLEIFSKHGLFDLELLAKGDLHVDIHHTNEDIGICLGEAFKKALGAKSGVRRIGSCAFPLDEAVTRVVIDLSGRPYLGVHDPNGLSKEKRVHPLSQSEKYFYSFDDAVDLWRAFTLHAGVTLHIWIESGEDAHHIIETLFKSIARALDQAAQIDPRVKGVPSTKGIL